jgi:Zn-dependent M16 (insulinase) family peptidase
LKKSLEVYAALPEYVEQFDADEREMTKYIIGAISEMDTPLSPSAKGIRSLAAYLSHTTEEDLQKERDQVLDTTPETIRSLAPLLKAVLEEDNICVVGNAQKCKEEASVFHEVKNLFE